MIIAMFCAGLVVGLVWFATKWGGTEGLCACAHSGEAHQHYRSGSDCSRCNCPQFRRTA